MRFVRAILLSLIFSFVGSMSAWCHENQPNSIPHAKQHLQHFVLTGDTAHVAHAVAFLKIKNKEIRNDSELKKLIERVLAASHKIDPLVHKQLLEIVREYYHEDRIKFFEYTLQLHNESLEVGDSETAMWTAIKIGNIFFAEQGYPQARKYYKIAEQQAIIGNDIYGRSVIYMNYGMIFEKQKRFQQALAMYKISMKYRLLSDRFIANSATYIKLANVYTFLNQPDSSAYYIRRAEESFRKGESLNLVFDFPFSLSFTKSKLCFLLKQDELAFQHLHRAKLQALKLKLFPDYAEASLAEIEVLEQQKHYTEVIAKANDLLRFLKTHRMTSTMSTVYLFLHRAYTKLDDSARAVEVAEQLIQLDDSLKKSEKNSKLAMINSMSMVNESAKLLDKAKRNLKIIAINNENRLKQRNYAVAFSLLSLFSLIVLAGLFVYARKSRAELVFIHKQLVFQNRNLQQNSQELNQSLLVKDRLLSIIANDLRVPFSKLLALLMQLKKGIDHPTLLNPMEKTLTESILLFEDLLSWSQTDKNQNLFSPKKVSIDENINKIILFYLPEIQSRGIQIINRSSVVSTFADQNILQTLLRNLLSNAITSLSKTSKKGIIEIKTRLTGTGFVEIIFSDSGAGFPTEIVDDFEKEVVEINHSGKGMGLALCNSLAKMSNWKMQIDNESNFGGARIIVTVPYFIESEYMETVAGFGQLKLESSESLEELKHLKFYQVTEIRNALKKINHQNDPLIIEWMRAVEAAIHLGDKINYERLLLKIEKHV